VPNTHPVQRGGKCQIIDASGVNVFLPAFHYLSVSPLARSSPKTKDFDKNTLNFGGSTNDSHIWAAMPVLDHIPQRQQIPLGLIARNPPLLRLPRIASDKNQ
jgi:hypothetical protein